MSIEQLQGAWRIEEAPYRNKRDHAYGFPNSHWIVIGDRGLVICNCIPEPFAFDFRLRVDTTATPHECGVWGEPHECGVWGEHGGNGYYETDREFLFIGLGQNGGRPPRFASDCGDFFAFQRDHDFSMPTVPMWPRDEISSDTLGQLTWDQSTPEYMGDWIGRVKLSDGGECEIRASDYLIPIEQFLPKIELTFQWLQHGLKEVKLICGEKVAWWVDEDDEYRHLTVEEVAATISVTEISASNGNIHLWATTSIPIDHVIRVWLDFGNNSIRATGASIEG
ncbi:hypothetical protein OAG71_00675 [bacterium]|nr:hypothetical protein [bacterium]